MLKLLDTQTDIVDGAGKVLPGKTWQCRICKARVREGTPHRGDKPEPHSTLAAIIVKEESC